MLLKEETDDVPIDDTHLMTKGQLHNSALVQTDQHVRYIEGYDEQSSEFTDEQQLRDSTDIVVKTANSIKDDDAELAGLDKDSPQFKFKFAKYFKKQSEEILAQANKSNKQPVKPTAVQTHVKNDTVVAVEQVKAAPVVEPKVEPKVEIKVEPKVEAKVEIKAEAKVDKTD